MDRPEYPNCLMPSETISHIRSEQEVYDADPEYYEHLEEMRALEAQQAAEAENEAQAMWEAEQQAQSQAEADYMQQGG